MDMIYDALHPWVDNGEVTKTTPSENSKKRHRQHSNGQSSSRHSIAMPQ